MSVHARADILLAIDKAHKGDNTYRSYLVEKNAGLVRSIVKRFLNRGHDAEDLFQVGCIGLIKAIDKFDTSYKVCFSTYAVPMITGEIKRYIRDDGIIKVSRSTKELAIKAHAAHSALCSELGREPTPAEIAKKTGSSPEEVVAAMDASAARRSLTPGTAVRQTAIFRKKALTELPLKRRFHLLIPVNAKL